MRPSRTAATTAQRSTTAIRRALWGKCPDRALLARSSQVLIDGFQSSEIPDHSVTGTLVAVACDAASWSEPMEICHKDSIKRHKVAVCTGPTRPSFQPAGPPTTPFRRMVTPCANVSLFSPCCAALPPSPPAANLRPRPSCEHRPRQRIAIAEAGTSPATVVRCATRPVPEKETRPPSRGVVGDSRRDGLEKRSLRCVLGRPRAIVIHCGDDPAPEVLARDLRSNEQLGEAVLLRDRGDL